MKKKAKPKKVMTTVVRVKPIQSSTEPHGKALWVKGACGHCHERPIRKTKPVQIGDAIDCPWCTFNSVG